MVNYAYALFIYPHLREGGLGGGLILIRKTNAPPRSDTTEAYSRRCFGCIYTSVTPGARSSSLRLDVIQHATPGLRELSPGPNELSPGLRELLPGLSGLSLAPTWPFKGARGSPCSGNNPAVQRLSALAISGKMA